MTGMLPICKYDFCPFIILNVLGKLINQRHVIVNVFCKEACSISQTQAFIYWIDLKWSKTGLKLLCNGLGHLVQVSGQFPCILFLYSQHMFAKLNWILPSRENDMLPQVSVLANRLINKWDLLNTSCVQSRNVAIGEITWGWEVRNFTCSKDISW